MKKDPNASTEPGTSAPNSYGWSYQRTGTLRSGLQYSLHSNREHLNQPANRALQQKINDLERQLAEEKQINQKLLAINQFGQTMEKFYDIERISQRMARLLQQLFHCSLVGIYHIPVQQEPAKLLAVVGPAASLAPGMLDPDFLSQWGLQASGNLQEAPFFVPGTSVGSLMAQQISSILLAPVPVNNELQGIILIADTGTQAFRSGDDLVIQASAARLSEEWEYADRANLMAEFIQSVGNLSMVQETASLMEIIASIARRTLDASFTVVGAF